MSLQLLSISDPRDNLEKARRPELVAYARQSGVPDITEQMPAILIRKKLRALGLTRIRVPDRPLFGPAPVTDPEFDDTPGVDVADDLARQFATTAPRNPHLMAYNEVRRKAKEMGLTFERRDNLASMRAKLATAMQKTGAPG